MTSKINASTSGAGGVITTADNSGILELQSGGTTIATISSTGLQTNVGAPAFSAYSSTATSLANSTYTKVIFDTEQFDTNNNFDNTTNYRFTPTVAGYYQVTGLITLAASTGIGLIAIYKNGASVKSIQFTNSSNYNGIQISSLIQFNGTTDYVEIYAYQSSGGTISTFTGSSAYSQFSAFLARSV